MVSSTYEDLKEYRAVLIDALVRNTLHPNIMENRSPRVLDVIDSSLGMVNESAAYIGIIGLKYGQTEYCPRRNPDELSLTELEFNEAQRLGRPILLFIMDDRDPAIQENIERDAEKSRKLTAFRERAKENLPWSSVKRVYGQFRDLKDFKESLVPSLSEFSRHLHSPAGRGPRTAESISESQPNITQIPLPPVFYAVPDYIGLHSFVGRKAELRILDEWAMPDDPTSILLLEAIGGSGKSMLTWEWIRDSDREFPVRRGKRPWAGRFWYSFYEKSASMADFCQRALAYITGQPLVELKTKKTGELRERLIAELHAKPYLIVLDGLERVLVAYHRIDAAQLSEDEADNPSDKIANREPHEAIHDEDDDLLRTLASAKPSKILVSSRLTPRVLLNASDQPIVGVRRITLNGLQPNDAEELLRSCLVRGDPVKIQEYLTKTCENHPLVIGILGGLIRHFLPARGRFDEWVVSRDGGAQFDLGTLDLVRRHNHILRVSFDQLSLESRELLCTVAMLPESVNYETLQALSPFSRSGIDRNAPYELKQLAAVVRDLEARGLLQFDYRTDRYDLHPVIRAAASRFVSTAAKQTYGHRVIDHFSLIAPPQYRTIQTLEDLQPTLQLLHTHLSIGELQKAARLMTNDLINSLLFRVEGFSELLSLLKMFFVDGWHIQPREIGTEEAAQYTNGAAIALSYMGQPEEALSLLVTSLSRWVSAKQWFNAGSVAHNIAFMLREMNHLAEATEAERLSFEFATTMGQKEQIFMSRLWAFKGQIQMGRLAEAEATWRLLDPMGRNWSHGTYRVGTAEYLFACFQFARGDLRESHLEIAERLSKVGNNLPTIRNIHQLRAMWLQSREDWHGAASSYREVVRLARQARITHSSAEARLALAKFHLGELSDPQREVERLAKMKKPEDIAIAKLWHKIGDMEKATEVAWEAYSRAWADGEPFVDYQRLGETTDFLRQLKASNLYTRQYAGSKKVNSWEIGLREAVRNVKFYRTVERW